MHFTPCTLATNITFIMNFLTSSRCCFWFEPEVAMRRICSSSLFVFVNLFEHVIFDNHIFDLFEFYIHIFDLLILGIPFLTFTFSTLSFSTVLFLTFLFLPPYFWPSYFWPSYFDFLVFAILNFDLLIFDVLIFDILTPENVHIAKIAKICEIDRNMLKTEVINQRWLLSLLSNECWKSRLFGNFHPTKSTCFRFNFRKSFIQQLLTIHYFSASQLGVRDKSQGVRNIQVLCRLEQFLL